MSDPYARRIGVEGVVILEVAGGSEADRAGLKGLGRDRYGRLFLRDVIVGIDTTKVKSYDDLYGVLDGHKIGNTVTLTVARESKERKVRLTLVSSD
jgi:S1-C subfamily serine protease